MLELYTVSWEKKSGHGSMRVYATSRENALEVFRAEWSQFGDEAPTCWNG